jgi:large subunit ribosomal protein L3
MNISLIGKKIGMTQVYINDGEAVAVTVVDVRDNQIVQVKNTAKDGYSAVQVGYDEKKESRLNKPALGHFSKHKATPKYIVRESRVAEADVLESGTVIGAERFEAGAWVDVIGVTKGKGFSGVMKRYNFKGQPASHGSMMHRRTGSIGCRLTPGLVWKNQKMPGRHGFDQRTVQNLKVIQSRPEDGVLLISGAIPGPNGSYVMVRAAKKKQNAKK